MSTTVSSNEQNIDIVVNNDVIDINVTTSVVDVNTTTEIITIESPAGAYPLPSTVSSVFGRTGSIIALSGDYNTSLVTENTNLYFTNTRARSAISLTTTGTSGAATYNSSTGVFNIPQYQGGVTSFNTRTGAISLLSADVTGALGFTPYNATNPAGYISGITSGNVTTALGYTPVTNARTLTINGTTYDLTADRSWTIAAGVTSVFGRTGVVVATEGDYTLTQLGDVTLTSPTNGQVLKYNGTTWVNGTDTDTGLTSVGLSMPSAFTVSNSPLTDNGTLSVTGAGTTLQYVRGDGSLATFPTVSQEAQRLITEVYNNSGATLTKGTVVYINGGQGNLPTVTKAIATSDATSAQTYGIVQTDITNMNNGFVVVIGSLTNLDTQAYADGTQLYLSSTVAGAWTSVKQYAPAHLVYVGIVTRSHPTQGIVEVRIQNGFEMDELHNVSAQTPSNGSILQYVTSTSLWTSVAGTTTNIAEGTNLYYTDVRARASNSFVAGSGAYNSTTGVITIPTNTNQLTNGASFITLASLSGSTGISYNNTTGVITSTITQYTDALARASISLTTTGSSGAATYNSTTGVLNIPQYSGGGSGMVYPAAGIAVSTGTAWDTSITDNSADWNTAYTNRITSLTVTGSSGAATLTSNTLNIPTYTLTGLGGQPLATNLTSLSALTFASTSFVKMTASGTFALDTNTYQGTLTLTTTGTSGAATLVGNTLNIPQYSGGGGGGMAIGGSITSATAGSVLFAGASGVLAQNNANFFWDDTNTRLGLGTITLGSTLQVNGNVAIGYSASTAASANGLQVAGTSTFADTVSISKNQNGNTRLFIVNTTSGTASASQIFMQSSSGSGTAEINKFSSTRTAYKTQLANDLNIYNGGTAGNISILNDFATGNINFTAGAASSAQMILNSSNNLGLATSTIGSKLQVNGNAAIGYSASTAAPTNGLAVSGSVSIGQTTAATLLEVLPSQSNSSIKTGALELQSYAVNNCWFGDNIYFNNAAFVRRSAGFTGMFYFQTGEGQFRFGSSSTAGSSVSNGLNGTGSGGLIPLKMNVDGSVAMGDLSFTKDNYTGAKFLLNSSGNLGLNIATAANIGSRLQVNGNAAIGYSASTAAPTNGMSVAGTVNVGTNTSVTTAALQVSSTTQGFLPPVMTTAQKNAITSPATGLVVFDSTLGKLCVFSTTWQTITSV
jgi:hypothetical protein